MFGLLSPILSSPLPPTLPSAHADAFTSTPYCGNPACVVLLPKAEVHKTSGVFDFPVDDAWMQKVALEMHLSETAFLLPLPDGPSTYALRWFTPTDEVDLCGHATLAASKVLWEVLDPSFDKVLVLFNKY